jgi:hypothetical protein
MMQSAPFVSKNSLLGIKWHVWSVCADFINTASRLGSVNIPDDVQFTSMAWVIKGRGVYCIREWRNGYGTGHFSAFSYVLDLIEH